MSDAILVALITGTCAVIAQVIIAKQNAKDLYAELDKRSELSDAKIHGEIDVIHQEVKTLSENVKKHNEMVERTFKLEEKVAQLERKAS